MENLHADEGGHFKGIEDEDEVVRCDSISLGE